MRVLISVAAVVLAATPSIAAVLCARPRADGTFSTSVKIREACKGQEVELGIVTLAPLRLTGPPTTSSTTTSTSSTTSTTTAVPLTATDPNTGLMWQLQRNFDFVENYADLQDADNRWTWTYPGDGDLTDPDGTAFTDFIASLNTPPCFAGFCDWRVPTASELLVVGSCTWSPCGDPWVVNTNGGYWSSDSAPGDPNSALHVAFGSANPDPKTYNLFVRAVRTGP